MPVSVKSLSLHGLEVLPIDIQVDARPGLPQLHIIGLPSKTVAEAKERLKSALVHSGVKLKNKRVIINLAPAELRKTNSHLDLGMAVGLYASFNPHITIPADCLFLGELSLDGTLRPVPGLLPMISAARRLGLKHIIFPAANQNEVSVLKNVSLLAVSHVGQIWQWLEEKTPLPSVRRRTYRPAPSQTFQQWERIGGQELGKRALLIALAGHHHLMLSGAPGIGKSLLAQASQELLPPLSYQEALEVTAVHSVVQPTGKLLTQPPFRSPHHLTTPITMLGGGTQLKPGEVTLAHRGVLFLDELPEFPKTTIEALRQPLEQKVIALSRHRGSSVYPADFILIATSNPCPCGYWGSHKPCVCSAATRTKYNQRISGPIRDRFHLWLELKRETTTTTAVPTNSSASHIQAKITTVRTMKQTHPQPEITQPTKRLLAQIMHTSGSSTRTSQQLLAIAQTIAFWELEEEIQPHHLSEAWQFCPEHAALSLP